MAKLYSNVPATAQVVVDTIDGFPTEAIWGSDFLVCAAVFLFSDILGWFCPVGGDFRIANYIDHLERNAQSPNLYFFSERERFPSKQGQDRDKV